MKNILRKPYEISLWEDIIDKIEIKNPETEEIEVVQYYKEVPIAIIGSNNMNTSIRAYNPIFTQNINGSSTLTFTINSKYYDETTGNFVDNPFSKLLVNERKVKLKYNNDWYDFIIKDIDENSEEKTYTYTAEDLFVNELSKNGFNLQLDTELENNQGTIVELADFTLKETDWKVDKQNSEIIQQLNEEALYEIVLKTSIIATNMEDKEETFQIESGQTIYGFYSNVSNKEPFFQFLYREDGLYEKDSDRIILNSPNYFIDNVTYIELNENIFAPDFASQINISDKYRGKRLVRKQKTAYDSLLDKYVSVYKDEENQDVYSYTENEYISPTILKNYITNASDFITTNGWLASKNAVIDSYIYPPITSVSDLSETTFIPFLKAKFKNTTSYIYNSGIIDNKTSISNFAKDEKYVFRIKYGAGNDNEQPTKVDLTRGLRAKVAEYTLQDGDYLLGTTYFDFSSDMIEEPQEEGLPFQYSIASCLNELSYGDLLRKKIGFFLYSKDNPELYYSIEEIQFFPYKTDLNKNMVVPGSVPEATVKTIYYFYHPNKELDSIDDISYLYKGENKPSSFIPVYNENYEKIRSITVSESNRFNIIQTLCETFECWAKFTIEHNKDTGEILLDENYRQKKWISFHNYIGQDNDRGFRYGINLKSIQRTLDSEQIVSKIVVKNNSNEFAPNGFCTISRAQDNPIKENFLLNFNYYIQQGLLDFTTINNDLYLTVGGYIGYYTKLRQFNENRDSLITEQTEISKTITQLTAQEQTYSIATDEAEEDLLSKKTELKKYCGYTYEQLIEANPNEDIQKKLKDPQVREFITYIKTQEESAKKYKILAEQAKTNLDNYNQKYEEIKTSLQDIVDKKEELNKIFYNKYSRFIQEGSWISEDYMDDNLYYLDAESTLQASASPKVTYTINVLELSEIEEYKNYTFNLGDKTYIEDTDFFGWVIIDGVKTPYQEEIVITEISYNLDSPESNQIKVQNYKTQFEDLFQRITATTQAVQYQSGSYGRAAGIITTEGFLKPDTLQNSFINNSIIISNAKDQSVIWDDTGITITSLTRPNEIVKLVSGGILLTNNGGETWNAGITGNGINANHITTGQIDASRINIMGGAFSAFRWDKDGLNAYKFSINETTGEPEFFNFGQFVRFDQWGLYGLRGEDSFSPVSEEEIREKADFGLTWEGFFLKSNHKQDDGTGEQGRIEISSDEDFSVIDGDGIVRIKIGLLDTSKYGLRLFNNTGNVVMETDDVGQLFLKEKMMIGPDILSTSYKSRAQLGVLESYKEDGQITNIDSEKIYSKIFSVKNLQQEETIAFYDNGLLTAKNVDIEGRIVATSGKIGNLTIEDIQNSVKRIEINSNEGNIFKVNGALVTPSQITLKANLINFENIISTNFSWEGSNNYSSWEPLGNGDTYIFSYEEHKNSFDSNGIYFVKVTYMDENGEKYSSSFTITKIDIAAGNSTTVYEIELNEYEIFKYIDSANFLTISPGIITSKGLIKNEGETQYLTNNDIDFNVYLKDSNYAESESNPYSNEEGWILLNQQIPDIPENSEPISFYNMIDSPLAQFFSFNDIGTIYNIDVDSLIHNDLSDNFSETIKQILLDNNTTIKIELIDKSKLLSYAIQIVPITFGTSKDMASFTLTNTGITAAIQNSTMEFSAEGLTIYNSGFQIISKDETVLNVDTDGNLQITGIINATDGYFHGSIDAVSGSFTGTVNAKDGFLENLTIQGLLSLNNIYIDGRKTIIENELIIDNPRKGIYSNDFLLNDSEGFFISDNGNIFASSITLGENAEIQKYINIGGCWIFNPEAYNSLSDSVKEQSNVSVGDFIVINYNTMNSEGETLTQTALAINKNGSLKIGSEDTGLIINGVSESIESLNYNESQGWRIDSNTAVFNNIIARGSIKTSVFEYGETQTIGGVVIVRPSSIIKDIILQENKIICTVENSTTFKAKDYVKFENISKYFLIDSIMENQIAITGTFDFSLENLIGTPLVDFGQNNSIGIGINSSEDFSLIPSNSISIFKTSIEEETLSLIPEIILGKIPEGDKYGTLQNKYGLYAESVYLKGAMVAKGENFSSGINTNSQATEKNPNFTNKGNILLWAGAKSDSVDAIENAKFRVDTYGNLYAGSGYFNGTIITDATISAAEIKTATITGWAKDEGNIGDIAALTIKDTSTGILFKSNDEDKMVLKENKLTLNMEFEINKKFKVLNNSAMVAPIAFIYDEKTSSTMSLESNKIGFLNQDIPEDLNNIAYQAYLSYEEDSIKIIDSSGDIFSIASFQKNLTSLNNDLKIAKNISYGDIMEYIQVMDETGEIIGYDLYIKE